MPKKYMVIIRVDFLGRRDSSGIVLLSRWMLSQIWSPDFVSSFLRGELATTKENPPGKSLANPQIKRVQQKSPKNV